MDLIKIGKFIATCRKEKGFGSIVKGLNVYGVKVVRPKELAVIKVSA